MTFPCVCWASMGEVIISSHEKLLSLIGNCIFSSVQLLYCFLTPSFQNCLYDLVASTQLMRPMYPVCPTSVILVAYWSQSEAKSLSNGYCLMNWLLVPLFLGLLGRSELNGRPAALGSFLLLQLKENHTGRKFRLFTAVWCSIKELYLNIRCDKFNWSWSKKIMPG